MSKPTDLLQGTLELLILKILALDPLHGWAVSQRLKQVSGDVLQVSDGSLYPALHRLEHEGWIEAEWKTSELGRRAKFYSLTLAGKEQLAAEGANWDRLSHAVNTVMNLKEAES
jgi:PadR family transcriptional regulator PadR